MSKRTVVLAFGVLAVAGVSIPERMADAGANDSMVGTWNVTYTANYSSCANVDVGDTVAAQLQISFTKGEYTATEKKGEQSLTYHGADQGGVLFLSAKGDGQVGLELKANGTGRRIVANPEPCAIVYDVKGKKAK